MRPTWARACASTTSAYYRDLCRRVGGKVLELGCGTGRILLPLLAAGVDIEGLDRSAPMLARLHADAAARGLAAKTHHRDLRTMPDDLAFDVLLAPYSLVTYLTEPGALQDWLHGARQMLHPDGLLVVDAFLPRDVAPFDDFREDYLRPHGDGLLRVVDLTCLVFLYFFDFISASFF